MPKKAKKELLVGGVILTLMLICGILLSSPNPVEVFGMITNTVTADTAKIAHQVEIETNEEEIEDSSALTNMYPQTESNNRAETSSNNQTLPARATSTAGIVPSNQVSVQAERRPEPGVPLSTPIITLRRTNASGSVLANTGVWTNTPVHASYRTTTPNNQILRTEWKNCSDTTNVVRGRINWPHVYVDQTLNSCRNIRIVSRTGAVSPWSANVNIRIDRVLPTCSVRLYRLNTGGTGTIGNSLPFNTPHNFPLRVVVTGNGGLSGMARVEIQHHLTPQGPPPRPMPSLSNHSNGAIHHFNIDAAGTHWITPICTDRAGNQSNRSVHAVRISR